MGSRERMIERLKNAQRKNDMLPADVESAAEPDRIQKLTSVLQGIGGTVVTVSHLDDALEYLRHKFEPAGRWVNAVRGIELPYAVGQGDPHQLENVQLAIIAGQFGVAENGAVWITSEAMGDRALPFICEHLALVIHGSEIVDTMRHAYARIGVETYEFGTFIAGPSKTADIEQSLVLGAHGPKSLTLFILS